MTRCAVCCALVVLGTLIVGPGVGEANAKKKGGAPSRSTTITLAHKDQLLLVVNRETDSLSILAVRKKNKNITPVKLAEVPVGREPRCVTVGPKDKEAYVTN